MHIIIYLTRDYKTIFTLYNYIYCDKEIGSLNGYGWKIVSIQYLIDKHFYTKTTYEIIVRDKEREKEKRNSLANKIIFLIDTLLYD